MQVSLIISTYNSAPKLQKVLFGYARQDYKDFEVVLADDGSNPDHVKATYRLMESSGLSIRHVWQQDQGFRKTRILNKAVLESEGDYLIFTDGDCIPRPDFVRAHVENARKDRYLSGGYVKLPLELSEGLELDDIQSGKVFDLEWLRRNGLPRAKKNSKLNTKAWKARLLNFITTTRPTFNGQNASAWKSDLLFANGFDQRMRYGAEDSELGVRLRNHGIRGRQIRYSAVCVHLEHGRPYVNAEDLERNRRIREETKRSKRTVTEFGITSLVPSRLDGFAVSEIAGAAVRGAESRSA